MAALVTGTCSLYSQGMAEEWKTIDGWGAAASEGMGRVTGVAVAADGRTFLAAGEGVGVVVLDPEGRETARWGDFLKVPHGLRLSGDRLFVTDIGTHVVHVCNIEGRALKTLGTAGEPGCDEHHFNQPTDVAVADDGRIFIADGYGNSRIVVLSKDFEYLGSWGTEGGRPGQFKYPHNIVIGNGCLYVADRANRRIQIFDLEGTLLGVWSHVGKPFGLAIGEDGTLWVSHTSSPFGQPNHGILQLGTDGSILASFGHEGTGPGEFAIPHSLALSSGDRLLTVGEVANERVQRFQQSN
jgi:DNA-binding beta-propeller fold protein YncE